VIGRILGDRYEIVERLGSGGMSVVYRARCCYLHRDVAVKVLHGQLAQDAQFLQHFRKEAWAAARLSHPNIVGIYDVGEEPAEDLYYIVMEHVPGPSLASVLAEEGPLPIERSVGIAIEILKGLNFAHRKGVVHRDIKPDNVIIDDSGRVKVTDFGIARAADTGTIVAGGSILGSARYMAPEQARGGYTDARADVYSVGVVLYEMLTGEVPFDGEGPVEIAMAHAQRALPDPRSINGDISDDLAYVVAKALEKEPGRRYSTAEIMGRDLVSVARGEPVRRGRARRDDRTRMIDDPDIPEEFAVAAVGQGGDRGGEDNSSDMNDLDDRHDPEERGGPSAAIIVLVVMALAAMGIVGYAGYLVLDWLTVPEVEVPPVAGERLTTAEAILEEHGLRAEVVASRHDDEIPANYVIEQDPIAERSVRRGHTVLLTVSEGPEWVEGGVPDVADLTRQEAEVVLGNVGLKASITERHHDDVPRGYVIDQVPEPGDRVQRGNEIALDVSLGPEPRPFELGGFIGKRESRVISELASAELEFEIVRESADFPEGIVTAQDPAPGREVKPGDTVTLVVSAGNEREPREEVISIEVPSDGQVHDIRIELFDEYSQRVAYRDRLEAGTSVDVTIYWYGVGARAFVYSGNTLLQSAIFEDDDEEDAEPGSPEVDEDDDPDAPGDDSPDDPDEEEPPGDPDDDTEEDEDEESP